jgi:peptidoglycan hydrolase-like protein with peptidoglycan-binding domain
MSTVQEVIDSQGNGTCGTGAVRGLSLQIIAEMNLLIPNVLVNFDDLNVAADGPANNPFLQPAAKEALRRAIRAQGGGTLKINSAYRTVVQQYLLRSWFERGQCGIEAAALPGLSNHEDGFALDIPDFDAWRGVLGDESWEWFGDSDRVHFTYTGAGVSDDVGTVGIQAFQILWNKNNPDDQLKPDGLFGTETEDRLNRSPAEGFGGFRLLKLITPNMQGEDVRKVQQALVRAGLLNPTEVDGFFGINTEIAVKNFQEQKGLGKDGIVGPQTRDALGIGVALKPGTSTDRWGQALDKAPTTGASTRTASQDGLPAGIPSSHQMASTDLAEAKDLVERFRQAAAKFDVPTALIAALASRESRCGAVLDRQGFGDQGNAFGVLQVDQRFHSPLAGIPDPTSAAHIEQAIRLFVDFRTQVQANHPDWEDEFVLKGAVVAYNSGVGNVQTKIGMDIGTTGGDYGSDVIARAQFYTTRL